MNYFQTSVTYTYCFFSFSPSFYSKQTKLNQVYSQEKKRERQIYREEVFPIFGSGLFSFKMFWKELRSYFFFLIDIWLFNNINEDEKEPQRSIHRHIHLFKSTFLKKQNIKCNFIFTVIPTCSYIFIWVFNKFFNAYIFV